MSEERCGTEAKLSDFLRALNSSLDMVIGELKRELATNATTQSQQNAVGTSIITVNALAWALRDAIKKMENAEVSHGGGDKRGT